MTIMRLITIKNFNRLTALVYVKTIVYEGQKQKWTVCEPFTILKEKSDKKSCDSFNICFVTGYVYT